MENQSSLLKKIIKILGKSVLGLLAFLALFAFMVLILPKFTIDKEADTKEEVLLHILTNGIHCDIILPVRTEQKDWSKVLKFENTIEKDTVFDYLALGWGDRAIYMETPTWADLKVSDALKAAFWYSPTVMHATYHKTMTVDETCKPIWVSKAQYQRLVDYVEASFQRDENGQFTNIPTTANYGTSDAFYKAKGSYHLFKTCNSWTNTALKACGQKACLWTALDKGIFEKYP